MDLLKAFDCISLYLVIVKLSANGFNGNTLEYIFTYLKTRKNVFVSTTLAVTSKI